MVLRRGGFSLLEALVSVAIVAILLGALLPLLSHARDTGRATVCASNLRQIGAAWTAYLHDHEQFPRTAQLPDWHYGGARFIAGRAQLDERRPLNEALVSNSGEADTGALALVYRCPADRGIFSRDTQRAAGTGTTPGAGSSGSSITSGRAAFEVFGTSYRANPYLMDAQMAGIDQSQRPLRAAEVHVSMSRLLLTADAGWWYATRPETHSDAGFDASWHMKTGWGNMLAADGSVRYLDFTAGREGADGTPARTGEGPFALRPRP
jgi:prepilin-type N-terminal cleavage/methylation domain-containing protein